MLLLLSLWSVAWGEMLQSFRPLALVLFSAQSKCSTRVQSKGGQEGSFGPFYLRLLRFQKLQTWIHPNSTSVSDTGQSGENKKIQEKKNKYTLYRTSFWGMLSGKFFSPTNQGCGSWTLITTCWNLSLVPQDGGTRLMQQLGNTQCTKSSPHPSLSNETGDQMLRCLRWA